MIGMILAAGVLLVPAPPPAAQPIIRGPGEQSCATWQSDETNKVAGGIWLLGYWTGLSQARWLDSKTGEPLAAVDSQGVVGEVQKVCEKHPSWALWKATFQLFVGRPDV
jgi:hypothetical protein